MGNPLSNGYDPVITNCHPGSLFCHPVLDTGSSLWSAGAMLQPYPPSSGLPMFHLPDSA